MIDLEVSGWPDEQVVAQFLEVGYSAAQVLEVILGVTMKTLSCTGSLQPHVAAHAGRHH